MYLHITTYPREGTVHTCEGVMHTCEGAGQPWVKLERAVDTVELFYTRHPYLLNMAHS